MALSYFTTFLIVPVIFAVTCMATVLLVGCRVLTPDKVVRIMFPYIRRNGNNTVMFGFILTRGHIRGLFWGVCFLIGAVIWTFCTNILIIYTNNNNLFSATSIELQCFNENGTIANLTAIERLQLDEDIVCYAINFNIAGAMGQATGALAFGWVVGSIITWVVLNVIYCIIKNNKCNLEFYKWFLFIITIIISLLSIIAQWIIIGLGYDRQWFFYLMKPENITIFIILIAVMFIFDTNITKEPKSFEEHYRETMNTQLEKKLKEMPDKEFKRVIMNIAKLEYQRLLVKEIVEKYFDEDTMKKEKYFDKDTMKKAAEIVFNEVIQNREASRRRQTH